MKEESVRSRQAKMQEDHDEAVREVDKWRERLSTKRKEVEFWMGKVDKSCIERIRAFQTPPILIGQIMEMSTLTSQDTSSSSSLHFTYVMTCRFLSVLTLIGRKPAVKLEIKEQERDKGQSTLSLSLSPSQFILAGRLQAERLDRNQWKQYTSLMADSGRFVDMLHGVNWQDGLHLEVSNGNFFLSFSRSQQRRKFDLVSSSGGILHCQRS
jgi:hypothetical protein